MSAANVVPRLVVAGADRAIEFYRKALGAEALTRHVGPDGSVVHAELRVGESILTLKDEDGTDRSATSLGGSPVLFVLNVDDADDVAAAMQRSGATVIFPVGDQSYGYRQGRLADPFGIQWIVSQRTELLSAAEVQERLDAGKGDDIIG